MKAVVLFAVLVIAKLAVAAERAVAEFPISIVTLFWQDALVALLFGALAWAGRAWPRLVNSAYYLLIAYTAFNVPIARLTSSALTVQMIRATGSALSDSIWHHLTPANVGLMALVAGAGVLLPRLFARKTEIDPGIALAGLAVLCAGGALLAERFNARGLERNAVTTLALSCFPRVTGKATGGDWRRAVARYPDDPALEQWRGAASGRNVVLIALESTGAEYLRPFGAPCDPMPHLSELARESILFENAYAVYPESIKGLFSVLCSRYPAFDTTAEDYARVRTPAIPEVLRKAGYRTALFHSGRFMYLGMRAIVANRGFERLEDAGDIGGNHNSSFGIDEEATVARILEWTASLRAGERIFVHYLPIAGHHPYEAPGHHAFPGGDERSRYLNALHYADAAIGRLMRGLQKQGTFTNTLFVIYGDHGEAFGQHHANFGHTFFVYDENVRVPLMIVAPGLIRKPFRVRNPASLIDIAPTIADLAGASICGDWQGRSLLDGEPRAALFFTDYSLPLLGLRDGPWKIICQAGTRHAELFHVETDPSEVRDHARERHLQVAAWRERLLGWASAQKRSINP